MILCPRKVTETVSRRRVRVILKIGIVQAVDAKSWCHEFLTSDIIRLLAFLFHEGYIF